MGKFSDQIRLLAISLLLTLFAGPSLLAQDQTVTGVVSSGQEPLAGVSVFVTGTNNGAFTSVDGEYTIKVNATDTLVFSYLGYETIQEPVNGRQRIDVQLSQSAYQLEEVVAVGYGTVRKKDLTGAISTVKGEELAMRNVADVTQALQGTMAGVQVSSNSGAPGSGASVLVRGISTINDNSPLYVVDDMPLNDISWLNPKDIESVQVLKDASAAAIFGSRASNGVIIIQTKKAKAGKLSIVFDGTTSIQQAAQAPPLADGTEYARVANQAAANSGLEAPFSDPAAFGAGTNWWEQVTQTAPIHNYSLSINKGTEDLKVSTGFSYFNQGGLIKGGDYERITLRLNTDLKAAEWLRIGQNFNLSKDVTVNGPNLVWDAVRAEPIIPVYLPEFEQTGRNEFSRFHPTTRTDLSNPMGALARNFDQTDYLRLVGNTYAILDLGRGFSAESRFGVYFSNWENNWFSPDYYIEPTDRLDVNQVGRSHNNRTNFNWNNLLHYTLQSDIHNLKVTAGYTMESFEHRTLNGAGNAVPGNAPEFRYIEAATTAFWAQGLNERNTQASYLSRVEYGYKYRYLISASFRADGSSRFSEENRWGFFPAVSAAWNIQEEAFLKDVRWLSQLKLRAGWGQVGNQNINNDALLTTLGRAIYVYGADEALDVGAAPATVGNPDLRWEAVEDLNFGLDFGLFNQSISFTVDYFERRSKDMLMQISIPAYLGAAFSTPWANVGRLETRGIELTAAYQKRVSTDLSFNIRLNASRARSTMRELAFGEEIWSGNHQRLDLLTRTAEGQPAGAFYGWVTNGIFQNEEEVINHTDEFGNRIQPLAQPGDFRFMDLNGDGRLDDNDRRTIGNPEPELTFGLNVSMNYKAFDLFVLFNGVYGNDVLNALQPYTHAGNGVYNAYRGALFDAWNGEGTSNTQPRLAVRDDNQNFRYSDYFIQDGTFLRLRSAQIGYTIPAALSQTVNINRARIFIGGENLFTWTNYSGLDPDIGGSALERGIDWGQYPLPQVFMAGVNITF
ncbi:MAG: SusC/RagA family TonB-linked outer membrane protein [Phaeodactylibacter xiamenensis]|uniref:TonB-dependent receptor plug domain-containing protein n=1 Tax=Phaeodactylibacter xiamenensis TaxID=1524460 RepID=A0A098S9T2_9BACT|nr:TonB-dependent receptor [Phaeodactylibacter xiamenensis]KGE89299.1 hypothetical protein IX84_02920 [Phaeodactylibacter xiamenensis]MCR9055310.1 TonB-dependent receptor [bacterium]